MRINIKADVRKVERDLRRVKNVKVPTAAAQALNRTNRGIRTDVVRAYAQAFNIRPQKRIRRRVKIPKDGIAKAPHKLSIRGFVLSTYVPEAYTIGRGVRALRGAQGPNKFAATMPTGHAGLFSRKPGSRHRKRLDGTSTELPISESLVNLDARGQQLVNTAVGRAGRTRWPTEFSRALTKQLRRR